MAKAVWAIALASVAFGAGAQDAAQADPSAPAAGDTAADAARQAGGAAGRTLEGRCVALLHGELDPAERADLTPRCEGLLRAGAEFQSAGPPAGAGREAPAPGEAVRTAFTTAGRELTGQKRAGVGATSRGDVRNTLVTNPLGWFSGLGVNVEYSRPLERLDRISWVADARYARANATNGQVTSLGLGGGVDLFLFGRNNEGLRIGPRLELALGSESIQGTTTFGRLGVSGEVGYNFIASSGLTAEVAGGLGTRLAGDSRNENFDSFTGGELGPYLKLGVGFSW